MISREKMEGSELVVIVMPKLQPLLAFLLRFSRGITCVVYDHLPRPWRGLQRFLGIDLENRIEALGKLCGLSVQRFQHSNSTNNYAYIQLSSMEALSRIVWELRSELRNRHAFNHLRKVLGSEPAEAYLLKNVAAELLLGTVMLRSVRRSHEPKTSILLCVKGSDKKWWELIIKDHFDLFGNIGCTRYWEEVILIIPDLFSCLFESIAAISRTCIQLLSQGLRFRKDRVDLDLATELADPARIKGKTHDINFWALLPNERKEVVGLFVTRTHHAHMRHLGISDEHLRKSANQAGLKIAFLDAVPFDVRQLPILGRTVLAACVVGNGMLGRNIKKGLHEATELLPLFANWRPKNLLYLTFPNGRIGFRKNDGVVTGISRRYGVKTFGLQTRAIYSSKFEDCFDCYDIYLRWGAAWHEEFPERLNYVDTTVEVGCYSLDLLRSKAAITPGSSGSKKRPQIAIFPSDISVNHHYSPDYALRFLLAVADLASVNTDCDFILKFKDPADFQIKFTNSKVRSELEAALSRNNIKIANNLRDDYDTLILGSCVIIAIGYTTPGTEGILLGKRVLFFSDMQVGGLIFRKSPSLIAKSAEELKISFQKARSEHFAQELSPSYLFSMDPYRDSNGRQRIYDLLFGCRFSIDCSSGIEKNEDSRSLPITPGVPEEQS